MHVGVDPLRGQLQEHRRDGVAAARQQLRVGLLDGALQRPRGDRAGVDEQPQPVAPAAVVRRRRRQALHPQDALAGLERALAAEGDRRRRHLRSPDRGEGGAPRLDVVAGAGAALAAGRAEDLAAAQAQPQGDLRPRQRRLPADPCHGRALAARPRQEAPPRRLPGEQLAQLDRRPGRRPGRLGHGGGVDRAAQAQPRPQAGLAPPRRAVHVGHRGDGRQGLAAEAVAAQPLQVAEPAQLRGGVAPEGDRQLLGAHAGAVVAHQDALQAGAVDLHLDAAGAGVAGVLQQLLERRGRPLDHLAGGDRVGHGRRQLADAVRLGRARGALAERLSSDRCVPRWATHGPVPRFTAHTRVPRLGTHGRASRFRASVRVPRFRASVRVPRNSPSARGSRSRCGGGESGSAAAGSTPRARSRSA